MGVGDSGSSASTTTAGRERSTFSLRPSENSRVSCRQVGLSGGVGMLRLRPWLLAAAGTGPPSSKEEVLGARSGLLAMLGLAWAGRPSGVCGPDREVASSDVAHCPGAALGSPASLQVPALHSEHPAPSTSSASLQEAATVDSAT